MFVSALSVVALYCCGKRVGTQRLSGDLAAAAACCTIVDPLGRFRHVARDDPGTLFTNCPGYFVATVQLDEENAVAGAAAAGRPAGRPSHRAPLPCGAKGLGRSPVQVHAPPLPPSDLTTTMPACCWFSSPQGSVFLRFCPYRCRRGWAGGMVTAPAGSAGTMPRGGEAAGGWGRWA